MLAKYEVCISYGSKVIAMVKVFWHRVADKQTESLTGQKLDAPEFHSGGIKRLRLNMLLRVFFIFLSMSNQYVIITGCIGTSREKNRQTATIIQKETSTKMYRQKGGDLTQSYDKSPYTNGNVKRAVTTQPTPQKSSIKQRLRTDLGRSVGVTTATQLVWLTWFTGPTFPLPATTE